MTSVKGGDANEPPRTVEFSRISDLDVMAKGRGSPTSICAIALLHLVLSAFYSGIARCHVSASRSITRRCSLTETAARSSCYARSRSSRTCSCSCCLGARRALIAFIPSLCLRSLLCPPWYTVLGIVIQKTIAEVARKAEFEKAVFNVATHALCIALTILVYLKLGGSSFLDVNEQAISEITRVNGFAAFTAFIVFFITNTYFLSAQQ